jgi:hypothetical protein
MECWGHKFADKRDLRVDLIVMRSFRPRPERWRDTFQVVWGDHAEDRIELHRVSLPKAALRTGSFQDVRRLVTLSLTIPVSTDIANRVLIGLNQEERALKTGWYAFL